MIKKANKKVAVFNFVILFNEFLKKYEILLKILAVSVFDVDAVSTFLTVYE